MVSKSNYVSSIYDCRNYCTDSYYDSWLDQLLTFGESGDFTDFEAFVQTANCYGQTFPGYADIVSWHSLDPSVVSVNYFSGGAAAVSVGAIIETSNREAKID